MADFNFINQDLIRVRDYPATTMGTLCGKTKLSLLHDKWVKKVWYSIDHESLQGHRGSYKTTGITEMGSLVWLLFNPNDRIAIIRKPYTEAAKTLAAIREYFKLEAVQALFYYAHGVYPKFTKQKENSLRFNFKTDITREGSIDAYGVDGSLTGNHYDKIILDDFITPKDRLSKAEREKTKLAVMEILANIIDPGKQCMFIGTPWHKDDAWGCVPEPDIYPVDSTGILSPEQIAEKKKRTTSSLYAANYDLKHIANEDAIFTDPMFVKWEWNNGNKVMAHLDCKYSGTDTNALTIMNKRKDGRIQCVGWVFEENIKEKYDWVIERLRKYRVNSSLLLEENSDKGFVKDAFVDRGTRAKNYHEGMKKHVKIVTYLKDEWPDLVWDDKMIEDDKPRPNLDPKENEAMIEYMTQITDYQEGQEPDDAPDSAASLLREGFYNRSKDRALYEW
jgi:hypothetical protein